MKRFIILILLLASYRAQCQLPYNSLINTCRQMCAKDILAAEYNRSCVLDYIVDNFKDSIKQDRVYYDISEIYKNYFPHIKIFTVTAHFKCDSIRNREIYIIDDAPVPLFSYCYALDTYTGTAPDMQNFTAFNKEMNASLYKLTNLDKCYLFIFLNHLTNKVLTQPNYYRKIISNNNNIYSKVPDGTAILYGNVIKCRNYQISMGIFPQSITDGISMTDVIMSSTPRSINVFAEDGKEIRYYDFIFNRKGDMDAVITHSFDNLEK